MARGTRVHEVNGFTNPDKRLKFKRLRKILIGPSAHQVNFRTRRQKGFQICRANIDCSFWPPVCNNSLGCDLETFLEAGFPSINIIIANRNNGLNVFVTVELKLHGDSQEEGDP